MCKSTLDGVYTLSEPKFVGKFPPPKEETLPRIEDDNKANSRGWMLEITSPKIYSWARVEGDNISTSDPLKLADLKHGDTIYVQTLLGIAKMQVEITEELGQTQVMAVNQGLVGHIVADDEGFAGCPMIINRKALEKARQVIVLPDPPNGAPGPK